MEHISLHQVAQVIVLAREIDSAGPELRGTIEALDDEEAAALVAVMWIGRGAFDPEDWDEAYDTALSEATTPTADYLIGTPHLAGNLEAGLDALGYDVTEAENAVL